MMQTVMPPAQQGSTMRRRTYLAALAAGGLLGTGRTHACEHGGVYGSGIYGAGPYAGREQ